MVVSTCILKAISLTTMTKTCLRLPQWNIAKILGKATAKAKTSNSTFRLKVKNYPYAKSAGVA
jgi:hypothetical protein